MRKLLTMAVALLSFPCLLQAQLTKKIFPATQFSTAVSKVIENFQHNYSNIQGAALPADDDREIFLSTIKPPGASRCVIYRFHSVEDTTASWQAILYTGEDFESAAKVYKTTFKQLNETTFTEGTEHNKLKGQFIPANESLRFTTSTLRPAKETARYKNFIAEVEMLNSMDGWTVQLNLHSRKDDDKRYRD